MKEMLKWAQDSGMLWDDAEYLQICADFRAEMDRGLRGEKSSMKMLPAYVDVRKAGGEDPVIVLDVGGTNLRTALIRLHENGETEVLYRNACRVPGRGGALSRTDFFDAIAETLGPIAEKSDRIGLCFSFPCEILPNLDGRVLSMSKEIDVEGIAGEMLTENIHEAMKRKGLPHGHRIAVLNDTVATLLSVVPSCPPDAFSGYIGMILGTGINTCYLERNERIVKAALPAGGSCIVNMESGGFDRMPRGAADLRLDAESLEVGGQVLEKMISGAYQGRCFALWAEEAVRAGVIGGRMAEKIPAMGDLTTVDLCNFITMPKGDHPLGRLAAEEPEQGRRLLALAEAVMDRSAALVSACFQGIMEATETGLDPLQPVCIAIEGTTYQKNRVLQRKIAAAMSRRIGAEAGRAYRIVLPENANLIGSAMAAHCLRG